MVVVRLQPSGKIPVEATRAANEDVVGTLVHDFGGPLRALDLACGAHPDALSWQEGADFSDRPKRWSTVHAILEYTYVDDYLERRDALRAAHLQKAWAAVDSGELLLGGAVGDGPYTALLIFAGEDPLGTARAFAEEDPYVTGGLVVSWEAKPWTTVVGHDAATPVRP